MVRRDVAGVKIARAEGWLAGAESTLNLPLEQFVATAERRDLAIFYLFLAIQECIDLAAHWVAYRRSGRVQTGAVRRALRRHD